MPKWTDGGAALLMTPPAGVVTTSDSTICVERVEDILDPDPFSTHGGASQVSHRLWMYGVGVASVSAYTDSTPAPGTPTQSANIVRTYLPQALVSGQWNIAYVQSNEVTDGSTAGAARYVFDLQNTALQSTAIPSQTEPRSFDGHFKSMAVYKDPHVLQLKNGRGWLMLLGRYTQVKGKETDPDVVFGPGGPTPDHENSSAAIVGYWCASPTFTGSVKGPYFLVARYHDIAINGANEQVPLWLGVPAACELEVDGEQWLYVYYTAELTKYANATEFEEHNDATAFVPGTYLKRFPTWHLPWGNVFEVALDSTTAVKYELASTDETLWNSKSGLHEVEGEKLGKVNIWVAEGWPWYTGEAPQMNGNALIWDVYEELKDVDAVPVVFDGGVALYFAGNHYADGATTRRYGWGVWRAVMGPQAYERAYGTDFVVRPVTAADHGGDYDMVARSNPTNVAGNWNGDSQTRLDPDPVRLPSGEWIVFSGSQGPKGANPFPLERFEAAAATAEANFADAWA